MLRSGVGAQPGVGQRCRAPGRCLQCPGTWLARDRDKGTWALLACWTRGLGVVGSLLGGCAGGVPPLPAALTVPWQIPKRWVPRRVRRSRLQRPSRPLPFKLSLRFNGKPWPRLKGLKSGIKAALARLLPDGERT